MTSAMARRDRSDERQVKPRMSSLRRILVMVSVLVVLLGLARLPYGDWFRQWLPDTYHVELQGRMQHVSDVELLEAVSPYTGVALWEVDASQVQSVVAAHPWLRNVKVNKRWPDVITLRLTEYRPMAQWGDDHLLDVSGVVFARPSDADVSGMPWLYSPDVAAGRDLWRAYARLSDQLADLNLPIERLWVDERGAWHLQFVSGLELRLGRHERDQRLLRFVKLVPRALGEQLAEAAYVDLRYGNGFAVGWHSQNGQDGKTGQNGNAEQDAKTGQNGNTG